MKQQIALDAVQKLVSKVGDGKLVTMVTAIVTEAKKATEELRLAISDAVRAAEDELDNVQLPSCVTPSPTEVVGETPQVPDSQTNAANAA